MVNERLWKRKLSKRFKKVSLVGVLLCVDGILFSHDKATLYICIAVFRYIFYNAARRFVVNQEGIPEMSGIFFLVYQFKNINSHL